MLLFSLDSVVSNTPAMSDDFWHDVSVGMGESFTAEECQNEYLQISKLSYSQEIDSGLDTTPHVSTNQC